MRERKEGLDPAIRLLEYSRWPNDVLSDDRPEFGFGIKGFTWNAHRIKWTIKEHHQFYRGNPLQPVSKPRPRWKKETVEYWKMLHIEFLIWNQIITIGLRLWKQKWTEPNNSF
jgi:hypothetical protein